MVVLLHATSTARGWISCVFHLADSVLTFSLFRSISFPHCFTSFPVASLTCERRNSSSAVSFCCHCRSPALSVKACPDGGTADGVRPWSAGGSPLIYGFHLASLNTDLTRWANPPAVARLGPLPGLAQHLRQHHHLLSSCQPPVLL